MKERTKPESEMIDLYSSAEGSSKASSDKEKNTEKINTWEDNELEY